MCLHWAIGAIALGSTVIEERRAYGSLRGCLFGTAQSVRRFIVVPSASRSEFTGFRLPSHFDTGSLSFVGCKIRSISTNTCGSSVGSRFCKPRTKIVCPIVVGVDGASRSAERLVWPFLGVELEGQTCVQNRSLRRAC